MFASGTPLRATPTTASTFVSSSLRVSSTISAMQVAMSISLLELFPIELQSTKISFGAGTPVSFLARVRSQVAVSREMFSSSAISPDLRPRFLSSIAFSIRSLTFLILLTSCFSQLQGGPADFAHVALLVCPVASHAPFFPHDVILYPLLMKGHYSQAHFPGNVLDRVVVR